MITKTAAELFDNTNSVIVGGVAGGALGAGLGGLGYLIGKGMIDDGSMAKELDAKFEEYRAAVRRANAEVPKKKLGDCKAKLREVLVNNQKQIKEKYGNILAPKLKHLRIGSSIGAGLLGLGGIAGGAYLANRIAQ